MQNVVDENGYVLGIALSFPIISALILSCYIERDGMIFKLINPVFIFYVGSLFLCSYYFAQKTFLFRWLRWICIHFSWPGSNKMAFFYFGLSVFFGVLALQDAFGALN